MKLLPIWAQAAIAAAVVVILVGSGYKVATWKWSGKVEKAVAAKEAAILERDAAVATEAVWREDVRKLQLKAEEDERKRVALQRAYDEAVNQPPEVVIEYRDRWHTVTETIVSHDCVEGVGQLFTFIESLPERPQ
jgi:hypothetical protein